jgi:hypothetical protein
VRTAEIIAALSLATDLGMGLPYEHGLHSTLVAMRLADRLGADAEIASATYYVCLLFHLGCTTDAEIAAEFPRGCAEDPLRSGHVRQPKPDGARDRARLHRSGNHTAVTDNSGARSFLRSAGGHREHMVALCEVTPMLTDRLGLPETVQDAFAHLTERWDGKDAPPAHHERLDGTGYHCGACSPLRTHTTR